MILATKVIDNEPVAGLIKILKPYKTAMLRKELRSIAV
jgi:hypothetical protein